MEKLHCEIWCQNCNYEKDYEDENDAPFECPECGEQLHRDCYVICEECGEKVYTRNFTNECECGALYNHSGQRLADPREWDEEDRYNTFGPQNNEDY